MASRIFDDDIEFLLESLKGIIVTFEDGTSTTMDQEMRKAFTAVELEQASEQSIAASVGNINPNPKPKRKCKGKENRKGK